MPENPTAPITPPPVAPPPSSATESIGSGPNQVVFENPAPPEAPPAPPPTPPEQAPYQVLDLENGQKEVKLATGSVFRGTPDQLLNELAKSVYNGSVTIAEMKGKGPFAPAVEPPPAAEPQMDATAVALADLVAQGLGLKDRNALLEQVAMLPQLQESYQQQQMNQIAGQFLAQTPDFPMSDANIGKLDAAFAATGMEYNPQNIRMVHNHLKQEGQYEKVVTQARPQVQNPMPTAPNGQGYPDGSVTEQDLWSMPMDKLEGYMRRR